MASPFSTLSFLFYLRLSIIAKLGVPPVSVLLLSLKPPRVESVILTKSSF